MYCRIACSSRPTAWDGSTLSARNVALALATHDLEYCVFRPYRQLRAYVIDHEVTFFVLFFLIGEPAKHFTRMLAQLHIQKASVTLGNVDHVVFVFQFSMRAQGSSKINIIKCYMLFLASIGGALSEDSLCIKSLTRIQPTSGRLSKSCINRLELSFQVSQGMPSELGCIPVSNKASQSRRVCASSPDRAALK